MIEWKWDDSGRMDRERDPSADNAGSSPGQGSQEARKKVGDQVQFTPAANYDHSCGFPEILRDRLVTGTVVQIHEEHRWFRVEYPLPGGVIGHECFKF